MASLREARNRLQVLEASERVAERTFEISRERFANGDITAGDLALDRTRLTQVRFDRLGASIAYSLGLSDLRRKTLYDFVRDESLVAPGSAPR